MINFDGVPTHEYDELTHEKRKLDISEVLKNIDIGNTKYLKNLPDEEKKQFTPYVVMRFLGSLDDSVQLTYKSKDIENIMGKWTAGAKQVLNEFVDEFNKTSSGICTNVKKYEHAKYDWRIGFSVQDMSTANALAEQMKEFGVTPIETVSLISASEMKNYLIMLNELVNVGFWDMQSFSEELYEMMCNVSKFTGTGELKRSWLAFAKSLKNTADEDIVNVIKKTVDPLTSNQINSSEYIIMLKAYDKKSFSTLLKELGTPEEDSKKLLTKFEKELKKYGN